MDGQACQVVAARLASWYSAKNEKGKIRTASFRRGRTNVTLSACSAPPPAPLLEALRQGSSRIHPRPLSWTAYACIKSLRRWVPGPHMISPSFVLEVLEEWREEIEGCRSSQVQKFLLSGCVTCSSSGRPSERDCRSTRLEGGGLGPGVACPAPTLALSSPLARVQALHLFLFWVRHTIMHAS